jgi:hypothetical protein
MVLTFAPSGIRLSAIVGSAIALSDVEVVHINR